MNKSFNLLALAQGVFYLITGLWPLLSIQTFLTVTEPKTDVWLVKTAGVLISVIGGVLALAGLRGRKTSEISLLALGSAAGLTGIDLVYVAKKCISPIYLLDALAETIFVYLIVNGLSHKRS